MIKINLLAEAKPVKKKRGVAALGGAGRLNLMLILGGLFIGLLVVGVQWWVETSRLNDQEEKNRLAQQEVTRLEAVLKEVADFEDKKAKLQKKVDLINSLKASQRGPVRLMDEVSNALPDLLWLDRMELKGNQISIDGKALNPPAVANFFTNLKLVQAFQEPKLSNLSAASAGSANLYNYKLTFVFADLDRTQFETAGAPAAGGAANPTPAAPAAPVQAAPSPPAVNPPAVPGQPPAPTDAVATATAPPATPTAATDIQPSPEAQPAAASPGQAEEPAPAPIEPTAETVSPPPPTPQAEIEQLLTDAQQQMDNRRFTAPASGNALSTYRRVLELQPDHPTAIEGIQRITTYYRDIAQQSLQQGRLDESQAYINRGLRATPQSDALLSLRRQVQQTQKAARQREREERQKQAALEEMQRQQLEQIQQEQLRRQQEQQPWWRQPSNYNDSSGFNQR